MRSIFASYNNRDLFRASCLWGVGESCLDGGFGHHALGAVLPRIQQSSIYQLRYSCRANAKHARGIRCGDGGDIVEFAADGYGDNLAAVSRLMSEVRHGKFNAVRIKELEFPYVNQVRPPLWRIIRGVLLEYSGRIDAAEHTYLKASRGHELLCCLAPSHGSLAVTKKWP